MLTGIPAIVALIPPDISARQGATMILKRLKQLVIGGAVLAALAVGSSATAGAATGSSGDAAATASAAPLASGRGGSVGAMNHVRDRWIHDLYLTDREQYVAQYERLASKR
jgi:hypothetical protein